MNKQKLDIKDLSTSQQAALWVILGFEQKSFYTSEVAAAKLFTNENKKAVGGILSALYRNGFIEKVSGGRDKLWRLAEDIEEKRGYYKKEIAKVKSYWR